jgi:hypothetical protein
MKPIESLQDVLQQLTGHRERLLHDAGLFPIISYGWLNEDSVDPEYAGHAIWQTSPPCEPDWQALFEGGLPNQEPTDLQIQLVLSGEDFSASMVMARYSAGMALCAKHAFDKYGIGDEYWLHIATSFLWLGIASDRIRDYFTLAFFGVTGDKFPFNNGDSWATPFKKAAARNEEEIARLISLGDELQGFRKQRHHVTHEIATRAARNSQQILREQQHRARDLNPYPRPMDITFEQVQQFEPSTRCLDEVDKDLRDMMSWYKCLIEASHIVFDLEYEHRREPHTE